MNTKTLHIVGKQAVRLMRMAREGRLLTAVPSDVHTIAPLGDDLRTADDLHAPGFLQALDVSPQAPLTLLVPGGSSRLWARAERSGLRSQVLSAELPQGAFLELRPVQGSRAIKLPRDRTLLISAPGLAMVDGARALVRSVRAKKLDSLRALLRLLEFADELCGFYFCSPSEAHSRKILYDDFRHPTCFTNPQELARFVQGLRGIDGLPLASLAARYAIDGSGSRMESYLNHALTLPPRYAGFSMRKPLANKQLVLNDQDFARLRHTSLRPDLQWPDYLTLGEYLGDKEHAGRAARREDKNRMQDYASTPYAAFPLMYDDVCSVAALNKTVLMFARAFMKNGAKGELYRVRRLMKNEKFLARQRVLVAALLPPIERYE